MGEVVQMRFAPPSNPAFAADRFLINEGLELLASYRSIKDRAVRIKLKEMIESAAKVQRFL